MNTSWCISSADHLNQNISWVLSVFMFFVMFVFVCVYVCMCVSFIYIVYILCNLRMMCKLTKRQYKWNPWRKLGVDSLEVRVTWQPLWRPFHCRLHLKCNSAHYFPSAVAHRLGMNLLHCVDWQILYHWITSQGWNPIHLLQQLQGRQDEDTQPTIWPSHDSFMRMAYKMLSDWECLSIWERK